MSLDPPRIEQIDEIDYRVEQRPWRFAVDEARAIDRHWDKLSARNPHLFNGRVFIMHRSDVTVENNRRILRGAGFEVEYKAFIAWRDFGAPDTEVSNCFAMAALLSADGAFVLGRMGAHTSNAGRIYFPSGTPDRHDLKEDGTIDLAGSVLRELVEETGIEPRDVTPAEGWTVVFAGPRVACMRIVRSPFTAEEIHARFEAFNARQSTPELEALHSVFSERDFDEARMHDFTLHFLRSASARAEQAKR